MFTIEFYEDKNGKSQIFCTDVAHQIDGDIWELIPGKNRIFYFKDNKFVLLHQFVKKTNKTPTREIEKAKNERDDYIKRNKGGKIK
ncbi:MAG: type II toxin-antitoxin system RelE/ParE family toxin [Eubacteriales bacterium]|nr:type II toxin-antitoxin system RelE/ParE family toxin [Eubacteriales bacterium]